MSNAGKCATQCTASPLVSTNPLRLVEGPIHLIFYHVRASTFHHYDRSMYVYGPSFDDTFYMDCVKVCPK